MQDAAEKTPDEVFGPIAEEGERKLGRTSPDLFLSGIIAGLDISFGAVAMAVVAGRLHDAFGLSSKAGLFWGSFFYPLGFLFVILGRSELFTENTVEPVAGLLRQEGTIRHLLRYWAIVFVTNIAGAVLFSLLVAHVDVVFTPYRSLYQVMGTGLIAHSFLSIALGGVLAGWLVALIAWLVEAIENSMTHVIIIYVTAYLIGGLGLFHCIIGSTEVLLGMFAGAPITWGSWLGSFLLPTTIGNIVGGVIFVTGLKGLQAKTAQTRPR